MYFIYGVQQKEKVLEHGSSSHDNIGSSRFTVGPSYSVCVWPLATGNQVNHTVKSLLNEFCSWQEHALGGWLTLQLQCPSIYSQWLPLNIIYISITFNCQTAPQGFGGCCLSILSLFFPLLSDSRAGEGAPRTVDHAVIGGVVAVVVFAMLCLLIVLGRYFARHKGSVDLRIQLNKQL